MTQLKHQSHILGFPRIGSHRQAKKAVEAYWREEISQTELEKIGYQIQEYNWKIQADAGLDYITVGDFSWYDHVLDTSAMLGVVPERFGSINGQVGLNTIFCMARGQAPQVKETTACEMTKWFNTNYHYIVPELTQDQNFHLATEYLFNAIDRAIKLGYRAKPVLLGPLSFLWLAKIKGQPFNKLTLLKKLLPVYQEIINRFKAKKIELVQIDEPILILDLPKDWQQAFVDTYKQLDFNKTQVLLATYFGDLEENLNIVNQLPVYGVHVDVSANPNLLPKIAAKISADKIISAGIINGRNIWKANLTELTAILQETAKSVGSRLWVATSSSLLHVPVDLDNEPKLDIEIKNWLAFAKQKISEVVLLTRILNQGGSAFLAELAANQQAIQSRQTSIRIHRAAVRQRIENLNAQSAERQNAYARRAEVQNLALKLPLFPTTTIGSFPQTQEIRTLRQDLRAGKIKLADYNRKIQGQIDIVIKQQEALDLDVLVHGEPERNDMVEYFGELLQGFAFTSNGWVQSYGSRYVKPPIIYGDVSRPEPMTVEWIKYAQSLTQRPVKGMLTGPVTILSWSFVRDDQSHAATALQIALALRDEVVDLERAGVRVIQIDEPAFREALPLRKNQWQHYLDWAVHSFRVASSGVRDETQIHTHMCYSEFNDVIDSIAKLDADVITIESSRSDMELLKAFEVFSYPNEIGPGVYDIHSPRIPSSEEVLAHLENAARYVPIKRLWVNPDCGLKTRGWPEVKQALTNMVNAAKLLRNKYQYEQ